MGASNDPKTAKFERIKHEMSSDKMPKKGKTDRAKSKERQMAKQIIRKELKGNA